MRSPELLRSAWRANDSNVPPQNSLETVRQHPTTLSWMPSESRRLRASDPARRNPARLGVHSGERVV